jgi:hypothetical protein
VSRKRPRYETTTQIRRSLTEQGGVPVAAEYVNSLVVEACLQDHKVVAIDEVDESVFFAYASRPCSGKHVAKWLRFANALGGVPQGVVDQSVDAFESGAVGT